MRRRLFEPISANGEMRDASCHAFANIYFAEGAKLPSET